MGKMSGVVNLMVVALLACFVGVIGQQYRLTYHVMEEEPEGTLVADIASDLVRNLSFTSRELESQRYSIFTKDAQLTKKFRIKEGTGVITTGQRLDREVECELQVVCELSFDVGFYYTEPDTDQDAVGDKIIRIIIQLEDINDNAPTFPERYLTRNISESTPVGQIIPVPPAIDKDMTGTNSVQRYILFPSDSPFGLNVLENPSGLHDIGIEVREELDREVRSSYRLTIIAKDGGRPRRSGTVDINITLTDVNDHIPNFNINTYTVIVQEDVSIGSTILTLSATDADSGVNSQLEYRISPRASPAVRDMFKLEIDTGELYPMKNLDYEVQRQYRFPVEVYDHGVPQLSSESIVVINITDVNDNAPQIFFKQSVFNLSEAAIPGTFSTVFSFSDADTGVNSKVSCSISDLRFRLENVTFNYRKVILQQRLDYEDTKVIEVNVTCRDLGNPPLKNASSFMIYVQDVNDNAPLFKNKTIFAHIPENNDVGDLITVLTAVDFDGPGNDIPKYGLVEPSPLVNVDQHTGEMRAKIVFDCETRSSFEVKVVAMDSKKPSLSSTTNVIVTIQDKNDMPPKFTQTHFVFNITENLPRNSLCGKLTAVDLDSTNHFIFLFNESSNVRNVFKLDSKTGELRTARKLTRENGVQHNFGVMVIDPDIRSFRSSADVKVYIMEDKDKAPVITFPNRMNNSVIVPFNSDIGTRLAIIRAIDDGRDGQIMLTFTIEQGNGKTLFNLNALSGDLILARRITPNDVGEHEILIAVHDNGIPRHTTYAYLTVKLTANSGAGNAGLDYLPIVISLVFVTIILGLVIFLIIMCVKRRDRKRKERQRKKEQGLQIYTLARESSDSPRYTSHNSLHRNQEMARREMFSVVERDNYKFNEDLIESSFSSEKDDTVSDLFHTRDTYMQGDTFLSNKIKRYRNQNHLTAKVDDGASDVTITTDSGRGASDEDINSNRALPFLHDSVLSNASLV